MVDSNSFYLGLEILIGAVVLGGIATIMRFFPQISERAVEFSLLGLIGAFLLLKGGWGLPGPDAIKGRLMGIVPFAAVAAWAFLAFRFWLSSRRRLNGLDDAIAVVARHASTQFDEVRGRLDALAAGSPPPEVTPKRSPKKLDEVGWEHWLRFADIELWQAVAVSLGFDPRTIDGFGLSIPELDDRLQLAESHMVSGYRVIRAHMNGSRYPRSEVPLREFIHWVMALRLPVPPEITAWFSGPRR